MAKGTWDEAEDEKGESKGSGPSGGQFSQIQDGVMLAPAENSSKIKGQNKLPATSTAPKVDDW